MEFKEFPDKVKNVINRFIKDYTTDPNVVGIVLVGSYVNSFPDPNSDIDIHIVLENSNFRERGNTFIDGYEIEYFINPIMQIYNYMESEPTYNAHTVDMFASGIVLYEPKGSNHLRKIIDEAKERATIKLEKMTDDEIELAKYYIDEVLKDVEDSYGRSDQIGFSLNCGFLLIYCSEVFFKFHQKMIPKVKRRQQAMVDLDPKFGELMQNVVDTQNDLDSLKALVWYLEEVLGGKRSKEWKLKGPLTI